MKTLLAIACIAAFTSCMTEKKMIRTLEAKYNMWPKQSGLSVPQWRLNEQWPPISQYPFIVPGIGISIDSLIRISYVQDTARYDSTWVIRR
jgi:hypothetical protein